MAWSDAARAAAAEARRRNAKGKTVVAKIKVSDVRMAMQQDTSRYSKAVAFSSSDGSNWGRAGGVKVKSGGKWVNSTLGYLGGGSDKLYSHGSTNVGALRNTGILAITGTGRRMKFKRYGKG